MKNTSPKSFLSLLTASALALVLTACDKAEKKEEAKVETKTEAAKTETTKEAEKKEEAKTEAKAEAAPAAGSGKNFKLEGEEPTEPALATLEKMDKTLVVARIEGETITVADLIEALKTSPDQIKALPLSKVYTGLVKRLRDMRALVKAAEKAGLDKDAAIQKKIKEAADAVVVKQFVDEKINAKITPEYLKKQFDEFMKIYMKEGKNEKEFRLMVAIVKDQKSANDLVSRVKKGEKFEDLVMSESTDDKVKETKGELGYVRFSDLPKDLAEKVQKAATGVIIDSPTKLAEDKWAIFKKMDQRDVPPPTFEEVAPDLKKVVMPQFFGEVLKDVLKDMNSEIVDYKTGGKLDEKAEEAKAEAALKAAQAEIAKQQDTAAKAADAPATPAAAPAAPAEAAPAAPAPAADKSSEPAKDDKAAKPAA